MVYRATTLHSPDPEVASDVREGGEEQDKPDHHADGEESQEYPTHDVHLHLSHLQIAGNVGQRLDHQPGHGRE
jgi:hypothetical protein